MRRVYDLMASNNPAYQEIVDVAQAEVRKWSLQPGDSVIDLGAGTGNFSLAMARIAPHARVVHVDNDAGMLEVAARKASAERLINVEFRQCDAMALRFSPQSLAGALSVHSLYAFAEPNRVLHKLHGWLKPGAPVLLCNLGRQLQVSNWAKFLFKHVRARAGMYRAVELFVRGRQVARQNNHISKKQRLGEYWTHSPEQFCDAVKAAGFVVHSQLKLYRGCSDLILGTRGAA